MQINASAQKVLFKPVDVSHSQVDFKNTIIETEKVNISMYDYLYNGGGVGLGDFNQDGLTDIFLSGNQVDDKLYINEGNFVFKDITQSAGINKNAWSTGVCVFDVNSDGLDDIYVCRSGWYKGEKLKNVLYVNQGNLTFTEESEKYGLDLDDHHVQAAPLDFDLDGDLDLYVMGHPGSFKHKSNLQKTLEDIQNGNVEGDVLLENKGGTYVDITEKSGIKDFGYGLGLAITDINDDHYPDIIVCNDFDEPDHLFVNQQDGTFTDKALSYFKHTSNYSMGNDVADINNDGLLDYISVDMAFESHERSKMNMASMNPDKFDVRLKLGWNHQYMHNMLQLNSGMSNFQEIGHISGIAKTDWSWAPLFADMDCDGYQDIFISNGYKRDTKNNDIQNLINQELERTNDLDVLDAIALIPSIKIENFFYQNNRDLTFKDKRTGWGTGEKINSNGAAFADLDNDGDLDLILNNVDTLASIYENTLVNDHNYITIDFGATVPAEFYGAVFKLKTANTIQTKEAYFIRGYQSSVEQKIHFYWPKDDQLENLTVTLTNGKIYRTYPKKINRTIKINTNKMTQILEERKSSPSYFKEVSQKYNLVLRHYENEHNDFEKESLLPHTMSVKGPEFEVADINDDGLDDIVVGSAVGRIPDVILQQESGRFARMKVASFFNHQMSEDAGIHVFDVNRDSKKDLIITSGGYQYYQGDSNYVNRLYIGNGQGNFGYVKNALPINEKTNSGKIIPADIDKDGDTDFFICGPADPGRYPYPGKSTLLINEKGFFKDKTKELAEDLEYVGMVNDAVFSDFDSDGDEDLILVGEWMNITIFENNNGHFKPYNSGLNLSGWWTSVYATDIDGDGDEDYLLGNAGQNNKFGVNQEHPLYVYCNDFDDNGQLDIVLSHEKSGKFLPVRGKECSTRQMPFLEQRFPTYISFATSSLEQIYSKEKLDQALTYAVNEFRSGILYNNEGSFSFSPFSIEGQMSFINDFEVIDINGDGRKDILAVGNRFGAEVETTRYDAGNGICYIQNEDGSFTYLPPGESGFFVPYDSRRIEKISLGSDKKTGILVSNNNDYLKLFELENGSQNF